MLGDVEKLGFGLQHHVAHFHGADLECHGLLLVMHFGEEAVMDEDGRLVEHQSRSSAPGSDSASFQASGLVNGMGHHQVGRRALRHGFQNSRKPFRCDAGEAQGHRFSPAGVQALGFGRLDDGAAIAVGHHQAGLVRHMLGREIRQDGEIEQIAIIQIVRPWHRPADRPGPP